MNFQMFKLDLEKAEDPEIKLPVSVGSFKKAKEFKKNICFIDCTEAFDCVDHSKVWKILKEMGIPHHLTCLLRNLYAGQEATEVQWNNRLVPNMERSMSRLYIVSLII